MSLGATPSAVVRAVIYTRVSQDPKGTKSSVEEQEILCRREADARGWNLSRVYCDNNKSASKSTVVREDWEELCADLKKQKFNMLVIWEPSRATRDTKIWMNLADECIENHVMICANGRVYDLSDPDDWFALSLFFLLSEREAKTTAKRVKRTTGIRAENGKPAPGKTPYGYQRVYNPKTRETEGLVPDDEPRAFKTRHGVTVNYTTANIVRFIFAEIMRGKTPYAISAFLNTRGLPNPRSATSTSDPEGRKYSSDWNPVVVRHIIRSPAYVGFRSHMGEIMTKDPNWEPLIDMATFYTIAAQFSDRKLTSPRPALAKYFLSRLAICIICERKVQATTHPRQATGYRCLLGHVFAPVKDVDYAVDLWIGDYLADPENIAKLVATVQRAEDNHEERIELKRLEAELEKWKASSRARLIDHDFFLEMSGTLAPEIVRLKEEIYSNVMPSALHSIASHNPSDAWYSLKELSQKREIVSYLVDVVIKPAGRGRRDIPIQDRLEIRPKIPA